MTPKVSLIMIARDEEAFIGRCLLSMHQAVDEAIVVDTGSTDDTVAVAKAMGAKVAFYEWRDHFADARNFALSLATGDWCVAMDADERLLNHHWQLIRKMAEGAPSDCHGIFFTCVSATAGPLDESPVLRMFRRLPHIRYEGRVHEEVGMTIQRNGGNLGQSQICIVHEGYRADLVVDRQKWERNEKLLLLENAERPGNPFQLYNLGHHFLVKGDKERAAPYFAESLKLSSPSHLYWSRLVTEARMCGILIDLPGARPGFPVDPVALGQHPDPLVRTA